MNSHAIDEKVARLKSGGKPRVLDLFSGCGGLSVGFRAAGFTIAALTTAGWRVLVIWECALRGTSRLPETELLDDAARFITSGQECRYEIQGRIGLNNGACTKPPRQLPSQRNEASDPAVRASGRLVPADR